MYFEHTHPAADVSAVTPAQRAQILREESTRIEKIWLDGQFDNIRDLMDELSFRIEVLEGRREPDGD